MKYWWKISGDVSKVTISATLEKVKSNYGDQKKKEAIVGEVLGDEEDKFPGTITYKKPASGLSKNVIITVDGNLNVSGYTENSDGKDDDDTDDNPKYSIFESEYTKTENYYYYEPDLSGFNPESTYYVTYDDDGKNETIYGRIDRVEKPTSGWHNYENKIWGNVVTVNENSVTYWSWIPRYKYVTNNKTADICFVDIAGNCKKMVDGNEQTVDTSSYKLPESFNFNQKDLKGYWISKYETQLAETSGIEQMRSKVNGNTIEVTSTNPSGQYTIFLDGVKVAEHQSLDSKYEIKGLKSNRVYDVCVYSETNNRMIGRRKRLTSSVISVDTSGFDKTKTYYVTYDSNGNETIAGRMDKISSPIGWYDYENKIWANLVTVNGSNVTYWTYIPRYEYNSDGAFNGVNLANVRFIPATQLEADNGYNIPECFTFDKKNLQGYWISKYEVQLSEESGIEQMKLAVSTTDITVTTSKPSGTYTIFLNGEKKETGVSLPYKISNLNSNTEYDICLYSEQNGRMVGTAKKDTALNNIIEVDLSGFNPDCTYYVTYDANGENEQIGDKIKLDNNKKPTNMPNNWYDYENKKWANIVTQNNNLITYWTYIPRYEYSALSVYKEKNTASIRFIPKTTIQPSDGYKIPECFKFGTEELAGYWITKYEIQGTISN